jgi:hypothetical protein
MGKRKFTTEEMVAQAEFNGYKRGLIERKTALDMRMAI